MSALVKNWLVFVIGVLWIAAAVWDIMQGRYLLATIWVCYGISSIAFSIIP